MYKSYRRKIIKLRNEIKKTNKWRDVPYSWIGILNIVKILVLPNLI